MSFFINGNAAKRAVMRVPGRGFWSAEFELAEEVELSGAVTVTTLDVEWSGTIVAGGPVDGVSRYRVIAGAGGWGRDLPPRAYANDAGVTPAKVIADAAAEAGEPAPVGASTTPLGAHYSRPLAPASYSLNTFHARGWYTDTAGVVQIGDWPSLPAPELPTTARDPEGRMVTLAATDTLAGVLPGAETEYGTASDVELEVGDRGVTARVYAWFRAGRRASSLARLLAAADPRARWRGVFEYRIVTQSGDVLNLQPVRARSELPDLARVPVRAGIPGAKATHTPGARVLVAFLDADPTRPAVVGFEEPGGPGWQALILEIGGTALGAARITDTVIAGPYAGTITSGSAKVLIGL